MKKPKTVAIIQGRRASTRLPDKILLDLAGEPLLVRVVERTRRAKTIDRVIVATTTDPTDDAVEALCRERGYPFARGSMQDVLDRYYQAARTHNAGVVVRITADCPLIDPEVIDKTVYAFLGAEYELPYDFAANRLPPPWGRTYPIGLDTEVCTLSALEIAWSEASLPHQREHVMPFFYEQPERFSLLLVDHTEDLGWMRLTVDTPEDLELLRQVYARFDGRDDFSWLDVVDLLGREPELMNINASVQHKHYRQIDSRRSS